MRELSLHALDIAQNGLAAGATTLRVEVIEDTAADTLTLVVADNGRGMTAQQAAQVRDPFYTTRTTRPVGLGIPLLCLAAEQTGGGVDIDTAPGQGTTVTARFGRSHIDCLPLGDMEATVCTLIQGAPGCRFIYRRVIDGREFVLDTDELAALLGDVPLDTPDVLAWIGEYVREQTQALTAPSR